VYFLVEVLFFVVIVRIAVQNDLYSVGATYWLISCQIYILLGTCALLLYCNLIIL